MAEIVLEVPRRLTLEETVQFADKMASCPKADRCVFDFRRVGRIEPFAMLFLSSEIQRFVSHRRPSESVAANFDHCSYAAHMGFFKAFWLDHGKTPGEAKGSGTYLPITLFDAEKMKREAIENYEVVGAVIEKQAAEMAQVLCRSGSGDLFDTLTYSIREIIRNVIEHSEASMFGFCAQCWPSYGTVELAIIDRETVNPTV